MCLFVCKSYNRVVKRHQVLFLATTMYLKINHIFLISANMCAKKDNFNSFCGWSVCTRYNIMWKSLSVTCGRSVFSPGSPVSSTNKTDRHDITEILLKVALNTITITLTHRDFLAHLYLLKTYSHHKSSSFLRQCFLHAAEIDLIQRNWLHLVRKVTWCPTTFLYILHAWK